MTDTRKRKKTGHVTLTDVARLAGVGTMTVSRALRTPEQVSDKLRLKIDAAVNHLGYKPNLAASALASAEANRMIAIVTPSLYEAGLEVFITELQKLLQQEGYTTILVESQRYLGDEDHLLYAISSSGIAALILLNIDASPLINRWVTNKSFPIININGCANSHIESNIILDNSQFMMALTEKVIQKGYQNIALLCANQGETFYKQRISGWHRAMLKHHRSSHRILTTAGAASVSMGSLFLPEVILNWSEVDALICTSDQLACGALYECRRRHITVPGDLAIVGFGDEEFAKVTQPSLSTIALPYQQLAQQAGIALLQRLNPHKKYKEVSLPEPATLLKIRATL